MQAAHLEELNRPPRPVDVGDAAGLEIVAVALNPLKVSAGDRVLVLGGTGSVGRIAAQAAELLGAAHVVAVGSRDLDRIPQEFGEKGFTVCIDPVWGDPLADALQYAQRHARIVHVGQSAGAQSPLKSADVRGKELVVMGHSNFALTKEERDRAYLELLDHLLAGRIEIDFETFALNDVADAWAHQRKGKSVVVLKSELRREAA